MDNKQIKELMVAMERSATSKLHIKNGSFELSLEREPVLGRESFEQEPAQKTLGTQRRSNAPLPAASDMAALHSAEELKKEAAGNFITSPMVGTYYSAPSPEDPPFLKVGDLVEKGDIVCIIEAMKVMNEIKAQASGTVVEIMVENGQPVEFGSKLIRIS